ncbi:cytochrome c biogenesis CcdA family protein [bacterium]|nr:cytochrome c biogenesis CcdA family protein [bacterium]MBU1614368.1 cytochrome c biogenesis CcdA family protein [bacterium]
MKEYIWKDFFKISLSIFIGFILSLVILAQVLFAQGKPTIEVFSEECPCGPCLKAEEIAKKVADKYNADYIVYDVMKDTSKMAEYGASMGSVIVNRKVHISVWEVGAENLEDAIRRALGEKPDTEDVVTKKTSIISWFRSFNRYFKQGDTDILFLLIASFALGLFAGLNPCAIGVFPVVVGYIAGKEVKVARSFLIAVLIGVGLTLVYAALGVLIGLGASLTVSSVANISRYVYSIGGIIILVIGLHMMKVLRLPFFKEKCMQPKPVSGLFGAVGVGVMLGFFYFCCVLPLLAPILTYLLSHPSLSNGVSLLSLFGFGMASPIIAVGLMTGGARKLVLKKLSKRRDLVSKISGGILVLVGIWFLWAFVQMIL